MSVLDEARRVQEGHVAGVDGWCLGCGGHFRAPCSNRRLADEVCRLSALAEKQHLALRNCRMLANRRFRHPNPTDGRPGDWRDIQRFCADAGVTDSILRAFAPPAKGGEGDER